MYAYIYIVRIGSEVIFITAVTAGCRRQCEIFANRCKFVHEEHILCHDKAQTFKVHSFFGVFSLKLLKFHYLAHL